MQILASKTKTAGEELDCLKQEPPTAERRQAKVDFPNSLPYSNGLDLQQSRQVAQEQEQLSR